MRMSFIDAAESPAIDWKANANARKLQRGDDKMVAAWRTLATAENKRTGIKLREKIEPLRTDSAGGVAQFRRDSPGVELAIQREKSVHISCAGSGMGASEEWNLEGKQRGQDLLSQEVFKIPRSLNNTGFDQFLEAERVRVSTRRIGCVIRLKQPEPWIGGHGV